MTATYPSSYYTQLTHTLGSITSFDAILQHHVASFASAGNIVDFQSLNSGTALIGTMGQANAYLAAYGHMHRQKLTSAFGQLSVLNAWPTGLAEVFDWGCGQGLASGVLLDYARHQLPGLLFSRFTLVEPSGMALDRATDHLRVLLPANGAAIRPTHHRADTLPNRLVESNPAQVKIHLFSNLLDMETVDYQAIARTIRTSQKGHNLFICVSPAINPVRDQRLSLFRDMFANARSLSARTNSLSGQVYRIYSKAYREQTIYRNECIFSVQL